ncbi:MAG: hypothetical protein ACFFD1_09015, partial [Candidatus Thorarchaeota archaeon]
MEKVFTDIMIQQNMLTSHRPSNLEQRFSITQVRTNTLSQGLSKRPKYQFYGFILAHCSKKLLIDLCTLFEESFGIKFLITTDHISIPTKTIPPDILYPSNKNRNLTKRNIKNSANNSNSVFILMTPWKLGNPKRQSPFQKLSFFLLQEVLHWCYVDDENSLDHITTYIPPQTSKLNEFQQAIHIPHVSHKQFLCDLLLIPDKKEINKPNKFENYSDSLTMNDFFNTIPNSDLEVFTNLRSFVSQNISELLSQFPLQDDNIKTVSTFTPDLFPFQLSSKVMTWWLLLSGTSYRSPFQYGLGPNSDNKDDVNFNKRPEIIELLSDLSFNSLVAFQFHWNSYIHSQDLSLTFKNGLQATGHAFRYPFLYNHTISLSKRNLDSKENKRNSQQIQSSVMVLSSQSYQQVGHYLPQHKLFSTKGFLKGFYNPYIHSWLFYEEEIPYFIKTLDQDLLRKYQPFLQNFQHLKYLYQVIAKKSMKDTTPQSEETKFSFDAKVSKKSISNKKTNDVLDSKRVLMTKNKNNRKNKAFSIKSKDKRNQIHQHESLVNQNQEVASKLELKNNQIKPKELGLGPWQNPTLYKNVFRSYKVGLRMVLRREQILDKSLEDIRKIRRQEEKKANKSIYQYEIKGGNIVSYDAVNTAINYHRDNLFHNGFEHNQLAEVIHDRQNLGQSTYYYISKNSKSFVDNEKKIAEFLKLLDSHEHDDPSEVVSWFILGRSPYLESKLRYKLKVNFDYARNLVLSSRRIFDQQLSTDHKLRASLPPLSIVELENAAKSFISSKLNELDSIIQLGEKLTPRQDSFRHSLLLLQPIPIRNELSNILFNAIDEWNHPASNTPKSRWKLLKKTARSFSEYLSAIKNTSYKPLKFFSIVRGIMVAALLPYYQNGKTLFELRATGHLQTQYIVTKPFEKKISHNNQIKLPLALIMSSQYVIRRLGDTNGVLTGKLKNTTSGNNKVLTELLKVQGYFRILIPQEENIESGKTINWRKAYEAEIRPSKKIIEFLKKGAEINLISLSSGDAPAHKIQVTLTLSGSYYMFLSKKAIIKANQTISPNIETIPNRTTDYKNNNGNTANLTRAIGIDLNRPCKNIIAFSEDSVIIPPIIEKLSNHFNNLGQVIKQLSLAYSRLIILSKKIYSRNTTLPKEIYHRIVKLRGELNRVYQRRSRILKELHRIVGETISAVLIHTRVPVLCAEDLALTPRGKHGALAKAILSMPD